MTYPSKTEPERLADFVVHAVSLVGFAVAAAFVIGAAVERSEPSIVAASVVYALAVLASIAVSFAYHLHPRHDWRAMLRRWDHAVIYLLIAGTFSPLLIAAGTPSALGILAVIWVCALVGVWFKLSGDNGDSRWSLISYLGMGGFAFLALPDMWTQLPQACTYAVAAGGAFYALGTRVYRRKGMPYRYPIWHVFGTLGGTCFVVAVWIAVSPY